MEYEIRPREPFKLGAREIWQYRELFYFFTWRDIKVKYKQTSLGVAWAILQPMAMTLIFTYVFSNTMKEGTSLPYPLFALSGLVIWNIFSSGLSGAGTSMLSNSGIIRKIYFPRLIIPISTILVSFFDFLMTLPVFIGVMIYYNVFPGIQALWLIPTAIVLTLVATVGAGCLLAALTVKFRDFRYVLPFLVQILLFVTPVIYPPGMFDHNQWIDRLLMLNPMSGAVTIFRGMFTNETIDWSMCSTSIISAAVILIAGVWYFRRTESHFADLA